jgi:hypothetical protein
MVSVSMDYSQFKETVTWLGVKKVPWIVGKSTGLLALGAKKDVQEITKERFNLHGEFIPKGVWSKPRGITFGVLKAEVRTTRKCEAAVYTGPIISRFMPIHEKGGTRMPRGKALAIPPSQRGKLSIAKEVSSGAFKTKTGKIKRKWQVGVLLDGYRRGAGYSSIRHEAGPVAAPFVIEIDGILYVVRRMTSNPRPLELIYIFNPKAEIDERWDFEETVWKHVNKNYRKVYESVLVDGFREMKI